MEVARRLWLEWGRPAWLALCEAVGGFLDEAAFRVTLAFAVLAGRVPVERERRWWNRSTETPVLVDAYDWTDERLLFSVLVWPVLEESGRWAALVSGRPVASASPVWPIFGVAWSLRANRQVY